MCSGHCCRTVVFYCCSLPFNNKEQLISIEVARWTLAWQHTYMKYKSLHPKMFYYSKSYLVYKMLPLKNGVTFLTKLINF